MESRQENRLCTGQSAVNDPDVFPVSVSQKSGESCQLYSQTPVHSHFSLPYQSVSPRVSSMASTSYSLYYQPRVSAGYLAGPPTGGNFPSQTATPHGPPSKTRFIQRYNQSYHLLNNIMAPSSHTNNILPAPTSNLPPSHPEKSPSQMHPPDKYIYASIESQASVDPTDLKRRLPLIRVFILNFHP